MARTLHEIFTTDYAPEAQTIMFKDWWAHKWLVLINFYSSSNWKVIPISVRGKHPLRAEWNYESQGAKGPYLKVPEAYEWVKKSFNLAVVAGPSKLIICDIDSPELFRKEWLQGIVAQTPRGYMIPLKPDKGLTSRKTANLKPLGYDFREDAMYELLPLSQTCIFDHGLKGKKHPGPRDPCLDGHTHNYRVREFVTPLSNPVLSFSDFRLAIRK
jgi:hypothetical protein